MHDQGPKYTTVTSRSICRKPFHKDSEEVIMEEIALMQTVIIEMGKATVKMSCNMLNRP